MKRSVFPIICLILVVIIFATSGCDSITSPPTQSTAKRYDSGQQTGIWVTGEGEVTVVPDVAILSLGVEVQADTVARAQSEASTAMSNITEKLDELGIADNDVQTQYFRISPVRNWEVERGGEEIVGYTVNNMVTVKVRNVDDTGMIIDAVAEAGGNYIRIDSIYFTVDDPAPYKKEAREKALADALDKAEHIADTADVSLGEPTFIREADSYVPSPVQVSYDMAVAESATGMSPISPGETTITIMMQIAYEIK